MSASAEIVISSRAVYLAQIFYGITIPLFALATATFGFRMWRIKAQAGMNRASDICMALAFVRGRTNILHLEEQDRSFQLTVLFPFEDTRRHRLGPPHASDVFDCRPKTSEGHDKCNEVRLLGHPNLGHFHGHDQNIHRPHITTNPKRKLVPTYNMGQHRHCLSLRLCKCLLHYV